MLNIKYLMERFEKEMSKSPKDAIVKLTIS